LKWLRHLASKHWIFYSIGLVILLVAGTVIYQKTHTKAAPSYVTTAARLGNISQSITISGTIEPVTNLELSFGSTGLVSTVNVQPGQSVNAGMVMATLDTTSLRAQVTQAEATVTADQGKLSTDEAGPTAASLQSTQAQISTVQNALANAQQALVNDEANNQVALTQAQTTLSQAQFALTEDQATMLIDQQNFANDQKSVVPSTNETSTPVPVPASASSYDLATIQSTISTDQGYVTIDQQSLQEAQLTQANCGSSSSCSSGWQGFISQDNTAISAAQAAISQANKLISDQNTIQNAQNGVTAVQVKNTQTITTDQEAITSEQTALANANSAASVANQPATSSGVYIPICTGARNGQCECSPDLVRLKIPMHG